MVNKFKKRDLETGSERLAQYLCEFIQSALDVRSGLAERWRQNESVYRNEPDIGTVRLYDNYEPRTVPIMSPRINRIVNMTLNTITSTSPWVQAVPEDGDQESASELERGMQTILERARFSRVLRRAMITTALCGVSIIRVRLTTAGVRVEYVHPNDFVIAPTHDVSMAETSLAGHRFVLPMWRLEERVQNGVYPLGGAALARISCSGSGHDERQADESVELFEVIARLSVDGKNEWYRIVVAPSAQAIMAVEKYPYDRPWYFDLRLHEEDSKWWPSSSVAQNIVGLCLLQNDMFNLLVAGSMATVANPIVISGGSLGKKLKSINLGQLFETPYDVKVQEIPVNFNAGAMPGIMDIVDNQIDAQTGVTQLAIGQEFLSSQTATAANALIESSKQNEASYAVFVSDMMEEVWSFVSGLVRLHTETVRAAYKKSLPEQFYESCCVSARWQAGGRFGSSSAALVQKLQQLLSLAEKEMSGYEYSRVEDALVSAMQLPVSTERLRKQ